MPENNAKILELRLLPEISQDEALGLQEASQDHLLQMAITGDEQAYKEIYRRYCRVMYTLAYQMLGNHCDADEVVQETFIRVFKNLHRLRSSSAFTSWLYQITINLSIDLRKARTKRRMLPLENNNEHVNSFELATSRWVKDPGQILENKELLDQITAAIDGLPDQQRAVVLLHEVEGLSKKMVSEVLGCSLVTVRTNLHHARKKLRKNLLRYVKS